MGNAHIISLIEAEEALRSEVADFLKSCDFAVEVFAAAEESLGSECRADTACVVIDAHLPGMDGLPMQRHLAAAGRNIPIILFITTYPDGISWAHPLEVGAAHLRHKASGEKALLHEIGRTPRLAQEEVDSRDAKPEAEISQISLVSVVDDDQSVRRATERLIRSFGFSVAVFSSAREFLLSSHVRDTACLILDQQMPHMNGLQLQSHLAQAGCRIPIIFITAYRDEWVRTRALRAGAVDFLEKPFSDDALLNGIRRALRPGGKEGLPR